jgi:hypothetical protein
MQLKQVLTLFSLLQTNINAMKSVSYGAAIVYLLLSGADKVMSGCIFAA